MPNKKTGIISTIVLVIMAVGVFGTAGHAAGYNLASSGQASAVQPASTPNELNLNIVLNGRGATFPAPLILNWTKEYPLSHPNVTINYNVDPTKVGSGAGQAAAENKTFDFAASDAPLSTAQRVLFPNILHIPETIGSVTAAYNLPTFRHSGLNFTGDILAKIYAGNITKWNDPQILAINPGAVAFLPAQTIIPVHRSDGSGTTFVFSSFLCQDSPKWCSTYGPANTVIPWPAFEVGGNGNGGVASYVNSTSYTLGYIELNYALSHGINYGNVQNPKGFYVTPSLQTTTYAVNNSTLSLPPGIGDWSSVSMINAGGNQTYPIASFTYLLIYRELNVIPSMDLNGPVQAKALIDFLNWVITTGQTFSPGLSYVALPPSVVSLDQASINSITFTQVSTPVARTFTLTVSAVAGWGGTMPGPSLVVNSGDRVTINFVSSDSLSHQWYIDFNNNKALDTNETNILSPVFSSTSPTPYTFIPTIWNQTSIPHAGTFFYRDVNNQNNNGTITILPAQVAAVFTNPSSLKPSSTVHPPVQDSSSVGTIGSLLIDARTNIASGNITIAAADKTSGAPTFTKSYVLSGLQLSAFSGSPGVQIRFLLNAGVLPYALSSNCFVQLVGSTVTTSRTLTRQIDFQTQGTVNINDITALLSVYGTSTGNPSFNPLADLNGDGTINILDVGVMLANNNAQVFR